MRLGIDCGGTKTEAVVMNGKSPGKIVYHIKLDKPSRKDVVYSLISNILKTYKIKFIGVGFPAPIMSGKVGEVNNIKGWNNTNIEKEISKRFRIPCRVENDAKCFAIAEASQKNNIKYKNIVGITLGTGIGIGIIINGNLYKGATGSAGEIGRIPMKSKVFGSVESIRKKENLTLEDLTSKKFFIDGYGIEPKDILTTQNPSSKEIMIINSYAGNIGNLIAQVALAYDPECIIIGGSIAKSWSKIKSIAILNAKKSIYKSQKKNLVVRSSNLKYAGCIGASLLKNY